MATRELARYHAFGGTLRAPMGEKEQMPGVETMWTPIPLVDLYEQFNRGTAVMRRDTRKLWEAIQIEPIKWQLHPWGDLGGGFWVVGLIGRHAVWYNDIEDGFNISKYDRPGLLLEYWCNQDDLNDAVCAVQHLIDYEYLDGRAGPPIPGPFPVRPSDK